MSASHRADPSLHDPLNASLRILLLADLILRFVGLASFTVFIGAAYDGSGEASSVGYVGLATAGPSILVLMFANRWTARFSALGLLRGMAAVRCLAFSSLAFLPPSPTLILIAAGVQSLSHQLSMSSKMTLDAEFLDDSVRRRYLARKAMLGNIAVVCAPASGGLIVGFLGYDAALVALSIAALCLLVLLAAAPQLRRPPRLGSTATRQPGGAWRKLFAKPEVVAIVGVYCVVVVVLEIQAPLVFPFVHEVYAADSRLAGVLLGLCGLGGLAGAYLAERWPKLLTPASIPWLVCLDGGLFFGFTQLSDLLVAGLIFTALGAMGSITLILVEGVVQTDVEADNRPFVFSLMQFFGGAGGAALGVLAAFMAERSGTQPVLAGAAALEIGIGVVSLVFLRQLLTPGVSKGGSEQ